MIYIRFSISVVPGAQSTIIHEYKRHVTLELTLLARKHVLTLIYGINSAIPRHNR